MHIYLDNAATTPIEKEVLEAMAPYFGHAFGNPSSIHSHGRQARSAIENARKTVARLLNCSPSEIFFTSGATEADNLALTGSVFSLGIKNIITSPIEHHAVLHTAEWLDKKSFSKMHLVDINEKGNVRMESLENLLSENPGCLVSLMHGNNEIGNMLNLQEVSGLCIKYNALFHSDTVQTIGHFPFDLQKVKLDFLVGSAHKFHGPKGIGFIYINAQNKIEPIIHGGSQERNMRGGTENVAGAVGLAKALEIACQDIDSKRNYLTELKTHFIQKLKQEIPGIEFNGDCLSEFSLPHVISITTPKHEVNEMLLFNLDIEKISVSGGSACTSGAVAGSHVLNALGIEEDRGVVRFSLSKYNTLEEIDRTVFMLAGFFN
ncbi:MAG: cysteine desulfurase [Opitutaceae bacterium]|nr:cysteine desulfurase [Cytophagales bacterium]